MESGREYHEKCKDDPGQKTATGEEDKRQQHLFFMAVEAGGDESPELEKNDRTSQKQAAGQGKLQIKKKPS